MSSPSATSTARRSTRPAKGAARPQFHRPPQVARDERTRCRASSPRPTTGTRAIAIDALNAGKDVYVRKAAHPEDRGRAADRQGRARQRAHLPGGHAAALRAALPAGQARVFRYRQAGQDHAGAHLVARQHISSAAARRHRCRRSLRIWIGRTSWARSSGATTIRSSTATAAPISISAAARSPICSRTGSTWSTCSWARTFRNRPSAAGGVYQLQRRPHGARHHQRAARIPGEFTATFEATLAPGITGAAVEMCGTEGRLCIDRGRYEFTPAGRGRASRPW